MNTIFLRQLIRKIIIEAKKDVLGEPDSSSEKHRDEPQPQYDADEDEELDKDEASVTAGITGNIGPLGTGNGPGNKPYGDEDE
ncbi:MAG: hypothetical protein CBB97_24055 [Candidatus Endolissoclinum sp. TMED37]|nr:MAG: hypothetical protein CBB97_24055 [Candidatus Endolissoclinum sp. TMED37]